MRNLHPIPDQLKHLPIYRGFPVPFVVLVDAEGTPHFKVNDTEKDLLCVTKKICHICGKKLDEFWFVGGHISAFAPNGAFNDGALHKECALYALKVCPYMAHNQYKAINSMVAMESIASKIKGDVPLLYNPTQSMARLDFFVLAQAKSYRVKPIPPGITVCIPQRPYLQVEYWKEGQRIHKAEAKQILNDKNEKHFL